MAFRNNRYRSGEARVDGGLLLGMSVGGFVGGLVGLLAGIPLEHYVGPINVNDEVRQGAQYEYVPVDELQEDVAEYERAVIVQSSLEEEVDAIDPSCKQVLLPYMPGGILDHFADSAAIDGVLTEEPGQPCGDSLTGVRVVFTTMDDYYNNAAFIEAHDYNSLDAELRAGIAHNDQLAEDIAADEANTAINRGGLYGAGAGGLLVAGLFGIEVAMARRKENKERRLGVMDV